MEIFSNEIAATLQYFTFPLEVIGLTLATIEVRFPETASKIAEFVKSEWAAVIKVKEEPNREDYSNPIKWSYIRFSFWMGKNPLFPISMGFILFASILAYFSPEAPLFNLSIEDITIENMMESTPLFLPFIPIMIAIFSLWAATRWVEGREVGTLGIILAGFGVLGEAYQFTTQLVV